MFSFLLLGLLFITSVRGVCTKPFEFAVCGGNVYKCVEGSCSKQEGTSGLGSWHAVKAIPSSCSDVKSSASNVTVNGGEWTVGSEGVSFNGDSYELDFPWCGCGGCAATAPVEYSVPQENVCSGATTPTFACAQTNNCTKPETKYELQQMVNAWCADPTQAEIQYGPIGSWNTELITNMHSLFKNQDTCNPPIGTWDVSSVTNFANMFQLAKEFNQPLASWDISKATNTNRMFHHAYAFNQNLNSWDMSGVTNAGLMFSNCKAYNQPMDSWDVSNVEQFEEFLIQATVYDQDLSSWSMASLWSGYSDGMFAHSGMCPGGTCDPAKQPLCPDGVRASQTTMHRACS